MPYIKPEDRTKTINEGASTSGELNYMITELLDLYLQQNEVSYKTMNDIIGALESAKLEFYARIVRPYEEKKIIENGDVYSWDGKDWK